MRLIRKRMAAQSSKNECDESENEKKVVEIKKKHLAKEYFGILSDWKRPTAEIKKEMRKGRN